MSPSIGTAAGRLLAADASSTELDDLPLSAADVVDGSPRAGVATLGETAQLEVGVWELTAGTVTDVEVDEVFVVLSGRGEVTFDDGSTLPLAAGTVVHLREGDRTRWTIHETVRKVYVAPRTAEHTKNAETQEEAR